LTAGLTGKSSVDKKWQCTSDIEYRCEEYASSTSGVASVYATGKSKEIACHKTKDSVDYDLYSKCGRRQVGKITVIDNCDCQPGGNFKSDLKWECKANYSFRCEGY